MTSERICEYCFQRVDVKDCFNVSPDLKTEKKWVCKICFKTHYVRCIECGGVFSKEYVHSGEDVQGSSVYVCDNCWEDFGWTECTECGALLREDDVFYRSPDHHEVVDILCEGCNEQKYPAFQYDEDGCPLNDDD